MLRSPQIEAEVGLVVKSETALFVLAWENGVVLLGSITALLVLPWEIGVVFFGSMLVVCGGVVVAASVLRAVCIELGSKVRLTVELNVPLDVSRNDTRDVPLDVPLVTNGEPVA